jgi:hypothetical protein
MLLVKFLAQRVEGHRTSGRQVPIGILGWRYAGCRGVFYLPKPPQRSELAFAANNFNSFEINRTPTPSPATRILRRVVSEADEAALAKSLATLDLKPFEFMAI